MSSLNNSKPSSVLDKKYAEIVIDAWDDDASLLRETEIFMKKWPKMSKLFSAKPSSAIDELGNIFSPKFTDSLKVLVEKGLNVSAVLNEVLVALKQKFVFITIKTAKALDLETVVKFEKALEKKYNQSVYLNIELQPKLIGGMVIVTPDKIIKGSIENMIDDLTKCLKN